MGRNKRRGVPGLIKIGEIWHIDKRFRGQRIRESCRTGSRREAEAQLAHRIDEVRQASVYGVRPSRTFRQAADKYLNEATKRSIGRDAQDLKVIDPFIGELTLEQVHMGTLQGFLEARRAQGVKSATVNRTLAVVRQVLNLAARLWRDEHGLTWLTTTPMIQMVDWGDRRQAYPLSVAEQQRLLERLPAHLQRMVLFALNTGARQEEICGLQWDWEIPFPELGISVFLVPGSRVKNGEDRVIVLNRVVRSIVEEMRGQHPRFVFTYRGHRIGRIYNSAWKRARVAVDLPHLRVHDLRHTFGRRLRAVGVPLETRKVLLGHKNGDITTHYSAPEIRELIDAVERLADENARKRPNFTLLHVREKSAST